MNINNAIGHIVVYIDGINPKTGKPFKGHFIPDNEDGNKLKEVIAETVIPKAIKTKQKVGLLSEDDRWEKHSITITFEAILETREKEG